MIKRRLFFALWPDESVRRELVQNLAPTLTDIRRHHPVVRPYLPEDFHLTLAFIGVATEMYHACLSRAARKVAEGDDTKHFSLEIDHLGYFERGKALWAGLESCPSSLAQLKDQLVKALSACGYEGGQGFKPHVTLMRKVGRPQNLHSFTPVLWRVNGFSLVESLPVTEGRRYRVIEEFKFTV